MQQDNTNIDNSIVVKTNGWNRYMTMFPYNDVQSDVRKCGLPIQFYECFFEVSGHDANDMPLLLCETDKRFGRMLDYCVNHKTPITSDIFISQLYKLPDSFGGFYWYDCPNGEVVVSKDLKKFISMVGNKPVVVY